ncbi:flagellar export chaperone FlgN [Nostocoides sp. HKS02]|uniref:flagellar export chaperone FlgN n=1 Tax=Nostocoides sp. HKS02 TaxID=1813880 RepID=UPI0012B4FF81|nr:flagellar export chaperone FlgN [Tetrasphaera sp. HKS02]QGN58032.1 flagellar biosynthesis protein FlgN [Tetrasphaera sp. HKS02]
MIDTREAAEKCAELSGALWAVRDRLERLAYCVEVQRALVETGRATWVARAAQEVELALEQVRGTELGRAVDTVPAATVLGLDPQASLSQIAALAPAPWDDLLAEHRSALLEVTRDLTESAAANRDLLAAGAQAVEDVLARFSGPAPAGTYGPSGARRTDATSRLFDQST